MKEQQSLARPATMPDYCPESDAHTLASAHEIHADSKRHGAARKAAKKLVKDSSAKAIGMAKVAGGHPLEAINEKYFGKAGKITKRL